MPTIRFTAHAVERFMERIAHEDRLSFGDAYRRLAHEATDAKLLPRRMPDGSEQWLAERIESILIVKPEIGGAARECVTVIPAAWKSAPPSPEEELDEEELAFVREVELSSVREQEADRRSERAERRAKKLELFAPDRKLVERQEAALALTAFLWEKKWFLKAELHPKRDGYLVVRTKCAPPPEDRELFQPKWRGFQVVLDIGKAS